MAVTLQSTTLSWQLVIPLLNVTDHLIFCLVKGKLTESMKKRLKQGLLSGDGWKTWWRADTSLLCKWQSLQVIYIITIYYFQHSKLLGESSLPQENYTSFSILSVTQCLCYTFKENTYTLKFGKYVSDTLHPSSETCPINLSLRVYVFSLLAQSCSYSKFDSIPYKPFKICSGSFSLEPAQN